MEPIRYKPGEAIRWLETGAEDLRKQAKRQGDALIGRTGDRNVGTDIRDAAGALFDLGKSALADVLHRQAQASEYVFYKDRFEVINSAGTRTVLFEEVVAMKLKAEKLTVVLKRGSVTIKPYAHIVSGRLKVPIGWSRNGLEVPYETLADELSARARVNIEHL
jgi:hypothetical protein